MKKTTLYSITAAFAIAAFAAACSKEDDLTPDPVITEIEVSSEAQQEENIDAVPFFELEKGDTIAKEIYREKPDFPDDVQILFSSENDEILPNSPLTKAVGQSSGSGYVYGVKASVSKKNDAPATASGGYVKIPVDLNEGAGGKWIYLYYTRQKVGGQLPLSGIYPMAISFWGSLLATFPVTTNNILASLFNSLKNSITKDNLVPPGYEKLGLTIENSSWADLNDGSGGPYIYLIGQRASYFNYETTGIRNILIVSSTSSMTSYQGWTFMNLDLNKGVGGKYIYLCYKNT